MMTKKRKDVGERAISKVWVTCCGEIMRIVPVGGVYKRPYQAVCKWCKRWLYVSQIDAERIDQLRRREAIKRRKGNW